MKKLTLGVLILLLCACGTSEKKEEKEIKKVNTQNGEEVYHKLLKQDYEIHYWFDYGDRDTEIDDYFSMENLCYTYDGENDENCIYALPDDEDKFNINIETSEVPEDLLDYYAEEISFTISGDKTDKDTWEYHFSVYTDEGAYTDYYWSKKNAYSTYFSLEDDDMEMYENDTCNFIERGKVTGDDASNDTCNTKEALKWSKDILKVMDTLMTKLDIDRDSLEAFADWTIENNINKQLEVLKSRPQEEKKDDK